MGRCTECNTCKKYGEMGRIDFATETGVCFVCVPELQLVICTVCRRERPATEFRGSITVLLQQYHRRCNDCRHCDECGAFFENASFMVSDKKLCTRCNTKHHCKICKKQLPVKDFQKVNFTTKETLAETSTYGAPSATHAKNAI